MVYKRDGYSFVEMLIIVVFVGIIAVIAVPKLNFSVTSKMEADTFARKIVTDLRRTRNLAISNAAINTEGYSLNMTGASPYNGYEIQDLDNLVVLDSHSIEPDISCTGGSHFQYGPLGNLLTGSDNQLVISTMGKTYTISITSATGMIRCTEN